MVRGDKGVRRVRFERSSTIATIPVILHADDLGLSLAFNRGIFLAASEGLVRSTCLRTNGWAYREAIQEILPQLPNVGVGVHLNVVEGKTGRSVTRRSRLCHPDGRYRCRFSALWAGRRDRQLLDEIEVDFRDQIERVLNDGIQVDHLNSHRHSHVIPALFDIVCRLAVSYRIPFVRLIKEHWYLPPWEDVWHPWYWANMGKHYLGVIFSKENEEIAQRYGVRTNRAFIGLLHSGFMSFQVIQSALSQVRGPGPIEILLHPTQKVEGDRFWEKYVQSYVNASERSLELATTKQTELANLLNNPPYELTNFRVLGKAVSNP